MTASFKARWIESRWALVPIVLLGGLLAGLAVMVTLATHDPGFALEPNYYQKAVAWDEERAQLAANERLGYRLELSVEQVPAKAGERRLVAHFDDARGQPISGAVLGVSAFANARAMHVLEAKLEETTKGVYVADLAMQRPGLWELRFVARRGALRFTRVVRVDLPVAGRS